jgi:hypothetical protein
VSAAPGFIYPELAKNEATIGLDPLVGERAVVVVAKILVSSKVTRCPFGAYDPTGECVNSRTNVPAIVV